MSNNLLPPVFLTHCVAPTSSPAAASFMTADLQSLAAEGALQPCIGPAVDYSYQQFISRGASPPTTTRMPLLLPNNKPLVLQVCDALDVTKSLSERVKGAAEPANPPSFSAPMPSANLGMGKRGMAKLLLSDGHRSITAIEAQPCAKLNQLAIGAKLVIGAGTTSAPTRLMLNASPNLASEGAFVLLLGSASVIDAKGHVAALEEKHRERMAAMAHKLTGRPVLAPTDHSTNRSGNVTHSQEEEAMIGHGQERAGHTNTETIDMNIFLNVGSMQAAAVPGIPSAPQRTMLSFGGPVAPTANNLQALQQPQIADHVPSPTPQLHEATPSPAPRMEEDDNATSIEIQTFRVKQELNVPQLRPPPSNQVAAHFHVYAKVEELISELAVVPCEVDGGLSYSLLASLSVASHCGLSRVPPLTDLVVDLGTPFVTSLLNGLPPHQYQALLEDESRLEELIAVAEGVATTLIELPPHHFKLEGSAQAGNGDVLYKVVLASQLPFDM